MPPLLTISNVVRYYGELRAVHDLSLSVEEGEIFGLLGPNGAGKTTTVRMVGATLRPSSGRVTIAGLDTVSDSDAVKRLIGYMAQRFSLYEDLTVIENLRFFAALYGLRGDRCRKAIAEAVELVDLADFSGRLAGNLSGGQRQLLALAVAVVHRPKLVILDEPTAGLDPIHRQKIWDLLYQLSSGGQTILVTTHGMEEAERCRRLAFINQGCLLAVDTPERLRALLQGRLFVSGAADLARDLERLRLDDRVAWAHAHQGLARLCLRVPGPFADAEPIPATLEDVFYDMAFKGREQPC